MPNEMDYSLIQRTPDGTGKILVTIPGIPDKGSYVLEADMKIYTNQGMVAIADIVDDLVTADATKPLSANQGVVLKQLIDAVSGGITPKGDILSSNLPAADDSNKGWQYYCTDLNKYATSDGTQWVYTSNSIIVQTPDATDTGHALSNAVVTQCCNEVKGRLNQHDARLQNLEQKAGDYTTVQYRGTNAVPTGKASYGLVKKIVGKTRAWNQLAKAISSANWSTANGASVSFSDGVATLTPTQQYGRLQQYFDYTANHRLLVSAKIKLSNSDNYDRVSASVYGVDNVVDGTIYSAQTTDWQTINSILYATSSSYVNRFMLTDGRASDWGTVQTKEYVAYDLTLIFGAGNEPSTVAEAIAQLSALGLYNAYDAGSLVSTTVEGVESVGVNIWDEEWELGNINNKTSALEPTNDSIRATNYTKVKPNSVIRIYCGSGNKIGLFAYDDNKNFIGVYVNGNFVVGSNVYTDLGNHSVTLPQNCHYIKIKFGTSYGISYKNDTQLSVVNGSVSTLNTTYHPYKTDTISLSETVTLRSAGSVADEYTPESGEVARKISNELDLSTLTWTYSASRWYASFTGIKWTSNNTVCNIISSNYETDTASRVYANAKLNTIACEDGNRISVYNGSTTTEPTGIIVYELATPATESIDPIIDNFLEVQGGGTVETIQTQTPVIDNCLDVGYLAV